MSEHTPTPWGDVTDSDGETLILSGKVIIAEIKPWGPSRSEERQANINRIVTAVNSHDGLLEALFWTSEALTPVLNLDESLLPGTRASLEDSLKKINAAIKAARP